MDLSIIVPVYNEKDNLRPLVDELDEVLGATGKEYEIIAIDDGSRDGSDEILREMARERRAVKAILFRRNSGQTAAFDAGFRAASGKVVVTMDADLQNDPHDIPAMVERLDQGFDLVSGWRKKRKDGFILRRLPSVIANSIIRRITKAPIHDLGCSLKVYRKEITDELRLYGEMHRFIAPLAESMGARIAEIVVNHRPRRAGASKYGLSRTLKVVLDLVTVWFMRGFQTKPIYVFGGGGLALLALGAMTTMVVLWEKLVDHVWVHRNPLFLIAIMLTITGVQFIG
ncbi:MAG: glycosyltransferase family 2 protein, partial [Polyangiaceae bacterium]|nr:glycosyltransferase family 2 protein [Polyangiaceae bacterium]